MRSSTWKPMPIFMIRCSLKNSLSLIPLILLLIFAHASCTKMDKTLGEDFIPDGQQLQVALFDATDFCSLRTVKLDSISTSNFSSAALGIYDDGSSLNRMGRTVAGFATTFSPVVDYGDVFGDTIVFDSVYLYLAFTETPKGYGLDKTTPMEIEVYELTATLTDSVFYGVEDYNASPKMIDAMIGEKVSVGTTMVCYDSTSAYIKLSNDLLPKLRNISSADTFKANFKGLYVAVKDDGSNGGCMKYVSIVNTSSTEAASVLVAMCHDIKADTVPLSFTYHVFNYGENSPRFNYIRHEHKALDQDSTVLYMQGLAGVVTELQLKRDSIEKWVDGRNIIVNRAELVLPVEDNDKNSLTWLDNLYSTTMSSIQKLAGGGYALTLDAGSYSVTFDGGLNRSLMQYSISITNTFNMALLKKIDTSIMLVPDNYVSDAASIFVSNKPDRKPQLKIWYSEIN